ncbi:hypothetical protein EJ05DRAFT_23587 [Pseudovirgaria hyperparasitica]|uniref:Zn(2)-C6 fungal-type domain-containing protein n=1 Tax=Pseudovirgaria hyperparasitica TaxID=470096 RepID=A0A6A6WLE3_9PEZI|nr:uncharacterized protein EJ05DRAFT_23587 [Pseudovirgaria hyperparasitica]KAF2763017.1 hypothetical protein EJ05DRAFT_23587 [Pseudovirgaria hyperparasitica]
MQSPPAQVRKKTARIRLSCLRCQKRKIRCDGMLPACGSCARVGASCVDGDHLRGRDYPRALRNRVAWLESLLQSKGIDLSQAPRVEGETEDEINSSQQAHLPSEHISPGSVDHEDRSAIVSDNDPKLEPPNKAQSNAEDLTHQIGLVSLSNGSDPKYIGPSSGFFFAQMMLASLGHSFHKNRVDESAGSGESRAEDMYGGSFGLDLPVQLPPSMAQIAQISNTYFEVVHIQWPFLHRPTFVERANNALLDESKDPAATFETYMVLAISSLILTKRMRISLPTTGYFLKAMKLFNLIKVEGSIQGLQCLLLLQIYTLYNPSAQMNSWYLNYQCIAAAVDLGLQRNIKNHETLPRLVTQMRRRIFWCVYCFDRTLGTMAGRPIGLRDEAFDVPLPDDVDDEEMSGDSSTGVPTGGQTSSHMSTAIHLFKLARLNSEMKYVLHSISREPIAFALPNIPDIHAWQDSMIQRLQQWRLETPEIPYTKSLCELNYHTMMQVLLRPTPAIPRPKPAALETCYVSAVSAIRLLNSQYRNDSIIYQSSTLHSIVLSTLTMFYCIWGVPSIADTIKVDSVMTDVRSASNMLAAAGEHWPGAKRSSAFLDELGSIIVRRLVDGKSKTNASTLDSSAPQLSPAGSGTSSDTFGTLGQPAVSAPDPDQGQPPFEGDLGLYGQEWQAPSMLYDCDASMAGFGDQLDFSSMFEGQGLSNSSFDNLMEGMFDSDWMSMATNSYNGL